MIKFLICILITLLPGYSSFGQSGSTLISFNTSDNPGVSPNKSVETSESGLGDSLSSIVQGDLSTFFLFGGLLVLFLVIFYFYNRYKTNRRISELSNISVGPHESFLVGDPYQRFSEQEGDFSGLSPSYISTESAPAILVAEEDDEIRLFITNTLRLNYRVISVHDGLKAFRKAFDTVPDLVITNSMMPGMDGVSLCHILKSTMATSHIPVIILNTDPELKAEGPVPADGCIRANFDAKSLLIEIKNFLNQRKHLFAGFADQSNGGMPTEEYYYSEISFINKVNGLLKNGHQNPRFGVEDLMEGLSFTKLQLFRKLKALTNKTPGDYIRNYRVEEAKRLLSQNNCQVTEVAARTGFANASGFSKAFKEVTGITPVEFAMRVKTLSDPVQGR